MRALALAAAALIAQVAPGMAQDTARLREVEQVLAPLVESYGEYYTLGTIPAGTYEGQEADVRPQSRVR